MSDGGKGFSVSKLRSKVLVVACRAAQPGPATSLRGCSALARSVAAMPSFTARTRGVVYRPSFEAIQHRRWRQPYTGGSGDSGLASTAGVLPHPSMLTANPSRSGIR